MKKSDDEKQIQAPSHNHLKPWQSFLLECVIFAIVATAFFAFVWTPGHVPSESMEPTLQVGDLVIANKLAYLKDSPQRGDVITFKTDAVPGDTLIKRVIGLPGEDVGFVDGYVYINGEYLDEDYLADGMETDCPIDFTVPDGCYFVMGDNRACSYDSRFWSNPYVAEGDIEGKMLCRIPLSAFIEWLHD